MADLMSLLTKMIGKEFMTPGPAGNRSGPDMSPTPTPTPTSPTGIWYGLPPQEQKRLSAAYNAMYGGGAGPLTDEQIRMMSQERQSDPELTDALNIARPGLFGR
jgi:hypothetical protein